MTEAAADDFLDDVDGTPVNQALPDPALQVELVVAIANFSIGAGGSILVLLAIEQLGTTEAQYGLMVGVGAAGGLVGALVASSVALRIGRRWAMTTGTAALAVGQLLLATAPDGIWATAGLTLGLGEGLVGGHDAWFHGGVDSG